MTSVGDSINAENASWTFDGEIVSSFEEHVSKSVPYYKDGHKLICSISDFFIVGESICYELGCSTGLLSYKLAKHHGVSKGRFVGIDSVSKMIEYARKNYSRENLEFQYEDALTFPYEQTDYVVCYYMLQFVHPSVRQEVVNKIYSSLRWGGGFICFEKVRAPDARFQDINALLYNDFKIDKGYTPEEIVAKSRSLKGILEPFSTQGNLDLFRRAGFRDICSVFKYLCFEGFLCIK